MDLDILFAAKLSLDWTLWMASLTTEKLCSREIDFLKWGEGDSTWSFCWDRTRCISGNSAEDRLSKVDFENGLWTGVDSFEAFTTTSSEPIHHSRDLNLEEQYLRSAGRVLVAVCLPPPPRGESSSWWIQWPSSTTNLPPNLCNWNPSLIVRQPTYPPGRPTSPPWMTRTRRLRAMVSGDSSGHRAGGDRSRYCPTVTKCSPRKS